MDAVADTGSPVPRGAFPMQTEPVVSFDDIPVDESVRDAALEQIAHLEHLYGRIIGCTVVIGQPHRHHRDGRRAGVHVEVVVPGGEVVVSHDRHHDHAREDVLVALRNAFHAARRRLEDLARRRRGEEKRHDGPLHGHVSSLFRAAGYGFITLPEGGEVYFHAHAVADSAFSRLAVGAPVTLTIEDGEMGPQAVVVHRVVRRLTTAADAPPEATP